MTTCRLRNIKGKDPTWGWSLYINHYPLITNLAGFRKLRSKLGGALYVQSMDNLETLEGLEGVQQVGTEIYGDSIILDSNKRLRSALALSGEWIDTATTAQMCTTPDLCRTT